MYAAEKHRLYWVRQLDKYEVGSPQWRICCNRAEFYADLYFELSILDNQYWNAREEYWIAQG